MSAGRFAPSPSGDLHVGNLRTAVLSWLYARRSDRAFLLRIEDLDRVRAGSEERQLTDLATLGLDWDRTPVRQSERRDLYDAAVNRLSDQGRVYECFCTRREIASAPTAPHHPPGAYPGTCRDLSPADLDRRRAERPAALRLRSEVDAFTIIDEFHGTYTAAVDDFVLRRGDGVSAYNLAVVVDDAEQGIDQVVRGDDLLASAPRQAYLATLLGTTPPTYVHVPLALNAEGKRLAKRDGAVTRRDLDSLGIDAGEVVAASLGLPGRTAADMLAAFDPARLPTEPWVFVPPDRLSGDR